MSDLDPDLKRLFKQARGLSSSKQEEAPFGFAGRVVASRKPVQDGTLLQELQKTAWGITCVSLVLIVCGGVMWASQRSAPVATPELPSALSFLASNLNP